MPEPIRYISITEFAQRLSLSRTTIYRAIWEGKLPTPMRLSGSRVGFPESEIEAYVARLNGEAA